MCIKYAYAMAEEIEHRKFCSTLGNLVLAGSGPHCQGSSGCAFPALCSAGCNLPPGDSKTLKCS